MPGPLLNVPLHKMSQTADCLAACASMVLAYIGHPVAYDDLLRLLEIGPFGTPAHRIVRLVRWGVDVEYDEGTLEKLQTFLDNNQPVIVLVRTRQLPYWQGLDTYHSVAVVGYDEAHIYVNDPYFDDAPKVVAIGDFVLAWLEMSYRYAVLSWHRSS
jgi:ABC-type bacteriocin/lantibiotic exporter with double-glycine peptidase domain